jgi:putative transposase
MDDEAFMSDIENLSLFAKTFKRDYARLSILPDAETVIALLPAWFEDYNEVHPHSGLKFLSPREFRRLSA